MPASATRASVWYDTSWLPLAVIRMPGYGGFCPLVFLSAMTGKLPRYVKCRGRRSSSGPRQYAPAGLHLTPVGANRGTISGAGRAGRLRPPDRVRRGLVRAGRLNRTAGSDRARRIGGSLGRTSRARARRYDRCRAAPSERDPADGRALLQHHRAGGRRGPLPHSAARAARPRRGPAPHRREALLRAARAATDREDLGAARAARPAQREGRLPLRVHERGARADGAGRRGRGDTDGAGGALRGGASSLSETAFWTRTGSGRWRARVRTGPCARR